MTSLWMFLAMTLAGWWALPALAASFDQDTLIVSGTRPIDSTGNEVGAAPILHERHP
jgi:hypothetical protein